MSTISRTSRTSFALIGLPASAMPHYACRIGRGPWAVRLILIVTWTHRRRGRRGAPWPDGRTPSRALPRWRAGLEPGCVPPARHRVRVAAGPVVREPEVELGEAALRVGGDELLHVVERSVRPAGEGGADLVRQIVRAREQGLGLRELARPVQ